ncbi:TerB family tellurite resistance protein [Temperatibacter marinus]|uniref:TerB family tellurite resistance protein n=1 Tax=Temperatibacter marinus TaxID=1456591 RepID=A0AA52HBH6_9PROT|nr:TerB family tellurite resistance protein [Temperatibacter marinus]WND03653.1 TerB family tellurite resistance protein [Temperatibacter marinus]
MSLTLQQEAVLKTISVMTHVDTNIHPVEVEMVQDIMKQDVGVEVESKDVYIAAKSEYIDDEDVDKYLKSIRKELGADDKALIIRSLKKVVLADGKAHSYELTLFNKVCAALEYTPADIIQL